LGDQPQSIGADKDAAKQDEEDEWKAAWSDEDGQGELEVPMAEAERGGDDDSVSNNAAGKKRELDAVPGSRILSGVGQKKKKISHHRSNLATLLEECVGKPAHDGSRTFQTVTDHIASLGPSAIDVSLSSLCSGMHDLEDGLPLLRLACMWLVEACESRERYEAINAYLHRFLYLHATVIAGIEDSSWTPKQADGRELSSQEAEEKSRQEAERRKLLESLADLRKAQQSALESLRGRMQNSLCLLRHFSRMV
jgi:U3 small nucleolar RNA-associated protein 21